MDHAVPEIGPSHRRTTDDDDDPAGDDDVAHHERDHDNDHDPGDGKHVDVGKHADVADAAHHGAHDDYVHELHYDVPHCDAGDIHDERERAADDDLGDEAHVDDIDDIDDIDDEHNDVPDADVRTMYLDNHGGDVDDVHDEHEREHEHDDDDAPGDVEHGYDLDDGAHHDVHHDQRGVAYVRDARTF